MNKSANPVRCPGCGAMVPDVEGPTHEYMIAAPGCWALFGKVCAREYGELHYPEVHHLTVDTYAVQHPGARDRRSVQSVAVHLIRLYCMLELGLSMKRATEIMRAALKDKSRFFWLEPPVSPGALTILEAAEAESLEEHEDRVRRWAVEVWKTWSLHHPTVRRWAGI